MAEYNPSKIIKDGNTYNFRDTTKIPLAGSNQISGDLIPSTDGTVNLGGSSYQWNNAYIKLLTINGVACGDILTHNASEFVDVTTAQTIGGNKTFTSLASKSNTLARGSLPATNINEDPIFISGDKNNRRTLAIFNFYNTNGDGRVVLYAYNQNTTNYDNIGLVFNFNNTNNSKSMHPVITNAYDLGTPTNKWKSLNGINPGALSLPSVSSGINLDLTNFKIDGSDNRFRLTNFSNYPYDNGWLFVKLNGCTSYYLDHWYKVVSNEYANPSTAMFFIPINDKDHDITLRCVCTSINYIRVFPCQGNV